MSRQIAFVFDLNKCIGCQTCSVACKVLWHQEEPGADEQWWCSVNTIPGRGTPRDWEEMGGGFRDGIPKPSQIPTRGEVGDDVFARRLARAWAGTWLWLWLWSCGRIGGFVRR